MKRQKHHKPLPDPVDVDKVLAKAEAHRRSTVEGHSLSSEHTFHGGAVADQPVRPMPDKTTLTNPCTSSRERKAKMDGAKQQPGSRRRQPKADRN